MKDLTPKLAHAARKVCVGSLHDDVVVIAYLAPRMTAPVEALADLSEEIDPRPPVGIVTVDHLAPIAARGHVVHTAGKPVTHRPGTWDEQMKDLTRKPRRAVSVAAPRSAGVAHRHHRRTLRGSPALESQG